MKIADYGKAITSYIESPTKAQKDKLKLQAGLLEEYLGDDLEYQRAVDDGFQGTKEDYYRYKSTSEEDRTFLAEGTPPPKKPRQLKDLFERINRAVLAVSSNTIAPEFIVPELETLTQEYISDGLISGEDARKFAIERKDYWDKWISENPGGTTPTFDFDNEGTATEVSQEEIIKRINEADGGRVERAIGGGVIEGEDLGTREGFANPVSPLSKPEVLKRIIELHQKNKLGAEAIAKVLTEELGFKVSRAPVGKQLTKLKAQGLIKDIPYAERAAAINQRGEFYGLPAGEKYLKIREIRDIDRTTKFKDTGKLKYNIPADAKFKIDFKNPGAALVSEIPDELQGVQYYKTKKDAQKALNKRNALVLTQPADPNSPATKAYIKRQKLLKRNAPFNFNAFGDFEFHHIMNIGGPIALDTSDIAIVSKAMNRKLSPYNRRLNDIGEEIFNLIETKPEGYLKKIKEQNKKGKAIVTEVKSKLPKEYRKLIGFNEVVPTFDSNKNVTGFIGKKFGGSEIKDGIKLADLSKNEIKGLKKQMISDLNKFQSTGLKDKILSSTGKVLKGVGKVIKPIGYAVGTKALFDARALAKEQGIELSLADQAMALDSGDPNVAINNYMRRNDPEFAAAERAKDLAKMTDDFEEVGQTTEKPSLFGKYNDQIKNIKLP